MVVRIMSPEKQHPGIMEYFRRNLGASKRMISLENSVYVEVVGETARKKSPSTEQCRMETRQAAEVADHTRRNDTRLNSNIQYVSMELKLNSKNEAHIKDYHNYGTMITGGSKSSRDARRSRHEFGRSLRVIRVSEYDSGGS